MQHIEELHKAAIFFSLWNVLIDSKSRDRKRTACLIVFINLSPIPHYFFMQLQEISGINLLTTACVQKAWPLQNRTREGGIASLHLESHYADLVQQRCFFVVTLPLLTTCLIRMVMTETLWCVFYTSKLPGLQFKEASSPLTAFLLTGKGMVPNYCLPPLAYLQYMPKGPARGRGSDRGGQHSMEYSHPSLNKGHHYYVVKILFYKR